jgi:hypothetical protein
MRLDKEVKDKSRIRHMIMMAGALQSELESWITI